MNADWKSWVQEAAVELKREPSLPLDEVIVESGAIRRIVPFLRQHDLKRVAIAVDRFTYAAAGAAAEGLLESEGIAVCVIQIEGNPQGDVVADEASIVQFQLNAKLHQADVLLAVGTGTLHDIARSVAFFTGIPFISVPTAPSVDGFNSLGAPILLRGWKQTITAVGPIAIFADLDILQNAPGSLIAAGFGDMLAKYTALFDWKFGHLTRGEPYSETIANLTERALQNCVEGVEAIAARTPEGVRLLMESLLASGCAMLLFGQSHPASGAEHHLSHHWEMEFLRTGRRQVLHGAKTGVGCAEISRLYHETASASLLPVPQVLLPAIEETLAKVPEPEAIRELLQRVGGPTHAEDLGVENELLERSIREATQIRPNRYTLLRAINENR